MSDACERCGYEFCAADEAGHKGENDACFARATRRLRADLARAELAECRSGKDALRYARDTCRRLLEAAEKRAKDMEAERDEARKAECYARSELAKAQHETHQAEFKVTLLQQELDRLRARMPSEAELEAFRFVCGKEWPWDVDDYKDAAEAWLARQEDDNG